MKSFLFVLLLLSLSSASIFAGDVVCLPDSVAAVFDKITLKHTKGNKYEVIVEKNDKVLLKDKTSYVYLRRQRYGRYRNEEETVLIKTLKPTRNMAQKASLLVKKLNGSAYLGVCKLYL